MYQFHELKRTSINHKNNFISELNNYAIFIPNENQQEIIEFIHSSEEEIKYKFQSIYKKFFLASDIKFRNSIPQQLKYRFPILNKFTCPEVQQESIISYLNTPNGQSGLLIINGNTSEFIEFDYTDIYDFLQFINDYVDSLSFMDEMLPIGDDDKDCDYNISLDDETNKKVNTILKELSDLKQNGELLKVLPIIEKYIEKNNTAIDQLSRLVIDNNYNILLPDYDLEIKLSHLTKSIYLLFLCNPKGIYLTDLEGYKKDLMDIYKIISNREDYDKMLISIEDVINLKTNAIYVHLSRIKSAFTKVLHHKIAEHYIVYGNKNAPKKIGLDKHLLNNNNTIKMLLIVNRATRKLLEK